VQRQNGIVQRHYVIDPDSGEIRYNNAQLTAAAVRGLCGAGFALDQLQCLAVGTSSPDQLVPGHGVMVHAELGSPSCEVLSAAGICLSSTTALKFAWMSVGSGQCEHAVAAGSEVASLAMRAQRYSAEVDGAADAVEAQPELAFDKDFLRFMLSDGAAAALLQPAPNGGRALRIDWIDLYSYAHELPTCMYAGADASEDGALTGWMRFDHDTLGARSVFALKQNVRLLNEHIIERALVRPLRASIARRGIEAGAIDWFLPHLSSMYFMPAVAQALCAMGFEIPRERWFTNLPTRGNTGSASMLLMLEELVASGRAQPGQRLLCVVPESGRFSSGLIHLTVV
jgi:3-oxoacyl-[acyl-carrier-protein] synthase-3